MKMVFGSLLLVACLQAWPQDEKADNVFIITTDGFRWQEVFNGADSLLISNPRFVADTALTKQMYWDPSPAERKKKLLPFFWNVLCRQGQLYGNRDKESKAGVKNIYKISYPGYNELLTGYADPLPVLNAPQYNRNTSVLEYLASLPDYKGRVAAFTSWNVFPFILNQKRSGVWQNSGYQPVEGSQCESAEAGNAVQEAVVSKYKTRYDALTFFIAKEYIKNYHPRVVFISLGETDEAAHQGRYDLYLHHASEVDRMLSELWYLVQTDTAYKNRTTFIISTDHGRGRGEHWTSHHPLIRGSGQIWLGMIGQGIVPLGEMHDVKPVYQNQLAATLALLLGEPFITNRKIGHPMDLPLPEKRIATPTSGNLLQPVLTIVAQRK